MLRKCVMVAMVALLSACVTTTKKDPGVPKLIGPDGFEYVMLSGGISPTDPRFPPPFRQSMYDRNRTGYRVVESPVAKANTFNAWVTTWGEGQARLRELSLLVKNEKGQEQVVYSQRWDHEEPIAGGAYQNSADRWFFRELSSGWNLAMFRRDQGDVICDTRGVSDQVHHVWFSTWPHMRLPEGSTHVGVRAVFAVYGDALVHFGLDRYAHDNVQTPVQYGPERNTWEVLHSQTFDATFSRVHMQDRTLYTKLKWEDE